MAGLLGLGPTTGPQAALDVASVVAAAMAALIATLADLTGVVRAALMAAMSVKVTPSVAPEADVAVVDMLVAPMIHPTHVPRLVPSRRGVASQDAPTVGHPERAPARLRWTTPDPPFGVSTLLPEERISSAGSVSTDDGAVSPAAVAPNPVLPGVSQERVPANDVWAQTAGLTLVILLATAAYLHTRRRRMTRSLGYYRR
jgi:hypothetical protein